MPDDSRIGEVNEIFSRRKALRRGGAGLATLLTGGIAGCGTDQRNTGNNGTTGNPDTGQYSDTETPRTSDRTDTGQTDNGTPTDTPTLQERFPYNLEENLENRDKLLQAHPSFSQMDGTRTHFIHRLWDTNRENMNQESIETVEGHFEEYSALSHISTFENVVSWLTGFDFIGYQFDDIEEPIGLAEEVMNPVDTELEMLMFQAELDRGDGYTNEWKYGFVPEENIMIAYNHANAMEALNSEEDIRSDMAPLTESSIWDLPYREAAFGGFLNGANAGQELREGQERLNSEGFSWIYNPITDYSMKETLNGGNLSTYEGGEVYESRNRVFDDRIEVEEEIAGLPLNKVFDNLKSREVEN